MLGGAHSSRYSSLAPKVGRQARVGPDCKPDEGCYRQTCRYKNIAQPDFFGLGDFCGDLVLLNRPVVHQFRLLFLRLSPSIAAPNSIRIALVGSGTARKEPPCHALRFTVGMLVRFAVVVPLFTYDA